MKRLGKACLAAAIHVSLVAFAGAASVEDIAKYAKPDRQVVLEAGARQEGALLVYTTGAQGDPFYAAFMKRYPYVRVQAFKGIPADVTRKIFEEAKAGVFNADVIDLSTGGLYPLRDAGFLQPYMSPQAEKVRQEAREPSGYWVVGYESYLGLGFNTQRVAEDQAPKDLDDLLDPRWRGKMALPAIGTVANWLGAVIKDKGEGFARKLATQQFRLYEVNPRALANFMVSGEVSMSPAAYSAQVATSVAEGAAIAWRPLGGAYAPNSSLAIAARTSHPHAALLYVDFALSPEGQTLFQALGYATTRVDIQEKYRPSNIYYLGESPTYERDYERWLTLARELFAK